MGNCFIHRQLLALEAEIIRTSFPHFLRHTFKTLNRGSKFLPNWHLECLADYLATIEAGQLKRLIINIPPRYLKSLTVSVAWPAWLLGQQSMRRIIVASYTEKLSLKHSLDCRHLLLQQWYQRAFPQTQILKGQNEKHKFVTTEHGFRMATSVGGTLTGEGGDILIVDDPLNPAHADSVLMREKANRWFEHSFASRLNDKKRGAMVIVMQRLHEQDLCGYLQEKPGWECLNLPAISPKTHSFGHHLWHEGQALHPAREDHLQLTRMKHEMGSRVFSAQYLQQPRPQQGSMIRPHWLYYEKPPPGGQIVQSWDTAIKTGLRNDFSVCITARLVEGDCHILEILRERLEYTQLRAAVLQRAEKWQPEAILIEDKASGQSLLQELKRETNLPLIAIMPKQDKLTRFAAVTPLIEAGKLILPPDALWLDAFERELFAFPSSAHDDQIDALSQLLHWWRKRGSAKMGVRRV